MYHILTPTCKGLFLPCIQGEELKKKVGDMQVRGHSVHAGKIGMHYNREGMEILLPI